MYLAMKVQEEREAGENQIDNVTHQFCTDDSIIILSSPMTVKVISPKELEDLAQKVDALIPQDLKFFRFGDRTVQIKRYLIENELDVTQTVAAIKRTAAWRKAWNADTIIASDVLGICKYINIIVTDSNGNGMLTVFVNFDIPSTIPFPPLERVIENIIFAMDHVLKELDDLREEKNVDIPIRNYGKLMLNGSGFNLHFVKNAFPNYPKTIMETLFCHYPSFLSLSDIYVSEDPNYTPPAHDGMYTLYLQNAPYFFKGLFTILRSFLPERWARQVCLNTDMYIPQCMDRSLIPVQNGGANEITTMQWLQHVADQEGCSLAKPTSHVVSSRIKEQYGQGVEYKACEMPNSYARARMWKMTNVRSRWHHYYFVLTHENILYYFADAEATKILTGFLVIVGCHE